MEVWDFNLQLQSMVTVWRTQAINTPGLYLFRSGLASVVAFEICIKQPYGYIP